MTEPQTTATAETEPNAEALQGNLRNAEKDFRKLIEKRNELNDMAREAREERDALNEQKKGLVTEMRRLQSERDAKNAAAREEKEKRNEHQRQAKALIESKRKMRKDNGATGQGGIVRQLENEIRSMERMQETTAMTVAKENELLEKIKQKSKELAEARLKYADEAKLLADVKDIDGKIDELFRLADEAHKRVVELSNEGQALHDQIGPVLDQLKFLDAKSDEKHQQYIGLRKEADEFHAKAMALRGEVEKLREERRKLYGERKAEVQNANSEARDQLFNEAKLEDKADDAMKALLAGGKISL
jgi:epidermal growth factor receptor substrate 15